MTPEEKLEWVKDIHSRAEKVKRVIYVLIREMKRFLECKERESYMELREEMLSHVSQLLQFTRLTPKEVNDAKVQGKIGKYIWVPFLLDEATKLEKLTDVTLFEVLEISENAMMDIRREWEKFISNIARSIARWSRKVGPRDIVLMCYWD